MGLSEKYTNQLARATQENIKFSTINELIIESVHTYFSSTDSENLKYFGLEGNIEKFLEAVSSLCLLFSGHLPIEQQTAENDKPVISFFVSFTKEKEATVIYLCTDRTLTQPELDIIIKTLNIGSLRQIDNNLFELLGKKEK